MDILDQQIQKILEKNQVQSIQKEILDELYKIREEIFSDVQNKNQDHSEEKDEQIKKLQIENAKLKYQLSHLTRNLKEKLENRVRKQQRNLNYFKRNIQNKNIELIIYAEAQKKKQIDIFINIIAFGMIQGFSLVQSRLNKYFNAVRFIIQKSIP